MLIEVSALMCNRFNGIIGRNRNSLRRNLRVTSDIEFKFLFLFFFFIERTFVEDFILYLVVRICTQGVL